jgi:S1-C subfamily serine protease
MESVLAEHRGDRPRFAPRSAEGPTTIREVPGVRRGGCLHCHQVKEVLNESLRKKGEWSRELIWRYPLPENIGVTLDVDRGNVVHAVAAQSPAAAAGVLPGDRLRRAGQTPIHSIADLMFALDRAPRQGTLQLAWQRGAGEQTATVSLADGWRRTDLTWRPSVQHLVPSVRLYGKDLAAEERQGLGLSAKQLAFRQNDFVPTPVQKAGVRAGDIVLGLDGKTLEMDVVDFIHYVQRHYLVGDRVVIDVIRNRERLHFPMELLP